ncbi:MAG TPA: hypothetical protein VLG47_02815 [Candidatus Saccharimonadales bacterium]|nr:hypothetical protein [Candidatus Saccharimonadales bacterium]
MSDTDLEDREKQAHAGPSPSKEVLDEEHRAAMGRTKEQRNEIDRLNGGFYRDSAEGHGKDRGPKKGKDDDEHKGKAGSHGADDDKVGEGYNPVDAMKKQGVYGFGAKLGNFFLGTKTRRNSTIAGSVIGCLLGGFGLYSMFSTSGFEYIQFAHVLEQIHFTTGQDESDARIEKLFRDVRYFKKGTPERTNLGAIGNRIADKVEAKFKEQGLESSYSKLFGIKEGYIIDKESAQFKGMSDTEIEKFIHDTYGKNLDVQRLANDGLMIVMPDKYSAAISITNIMLQKAGVWKLPAAIGTRVMAARDRVTLHPLRILDKKLYKTLDARYAKWQQDKIANEKNGITDAQLAAQDEADKQSGKTGQQNAKDAASEADQTINEGKDAGKALNEGKTGPVDALTNHIGTKLAVGGAGAVAILCIARGLASNAGQVKQDQLVLPLARVGMRTIAEGNQVEFGKSDIDPQQLQLDSKQLYDPTTKSTWYDAKSIQAGLGKANTGYPPSDTLQTIGKGTPFDFLLTGAFGSALAPVCSAAGQAVITIITFLGGPISAIGSLIAGAAFGPPIFNAIAHWLAGDAANIAARGAAHGANADFGAHFASNDAMISAGSAALSKAETTQLSQIQIDQNQAIFDHHNLAYRLFSPTDSRSFMASFINQTSPSLVQNISNAMFGIMNIGHTIINQFSTIISGAPVHAASTYDYGGVPTYAQSVADMNNPLVQHPYESSDGPGGAADILAGAQGGKYIDRAQKCFGDTIALEDTPKGKQWNVTFGTEPVNTFSPEYKNIAGDCAIENDPNWTRIKFFIFDDQNAKAVDCYLTGNDDSCTAVGMLNG